MSHVTFTVKRAFNEYKKNSTDSNLRNLRRLLNKNYTTENDRKAVIATLTNGKANFIQ